MRAIAERLHSQKYELLEIIRSAYNAGMAEQDGLSLEQLLAKVESPC